MLRANNLTYQYKNGSPLQFPKIELQQQGQLLILGQSGSGKTTLLHLLAGLRQPKSGSVRINEADLQKLSATALDRFRGKEIGIVFQRPHFLRSLTLLENFRLVQNLSKKRTSIEQLIESLGLSHRKNAYQQALSEGEKQRVSIGLALVNRPSVLFADEPTSSLDDENCEQVIQLLKNQAETWQTTLVIVTHDHRLKEHFEQTISL